MSPVLKNPCDPSQDSDHNNLFSFLNNKDFRKLYNQLIKSAEKYAKCHAKVWFLQQCREHKLIPKTLRISNKPTDENLAPEWNSVTQSTCLEWLRLALEKEEIREKELIAEMVERHDTIALLANDETVTA